MNRSRLIRRSSDDSVAQHYLSFDNIEKRRNSSSNFTNVPEYELTRSQRIRRPSESDELYRQALYGAKSKRLAEHRNSCEPRPISEKIERKVSKQKSLEERKSGDSEELPSIKRAVSLRHFAAGIASSEELREVASIPYMVHSEPKGEYLSRHSMSLSETHFPTLGSGAMMTNGKRMSLEDIKQLEKDLKRTMI